MAVAAILTLHVTRHARIWRRARASARKTRTAAQLIEGFLLQLEVMSLQSLNEPLRTVGCLMEQFLLRAAADLGRNGASCNPRRPRNESEDFLEARRLDRACCDRSQFWQSGRTPCL